MGAQDQAENMTESEPDHKMRWRVISLAGRYTVEEFGKGTRGQWYWMRLDPALGYNPRDINSCQAYIIGRKIQLGLGGEVVWEYE